MFEQASRTKLRYTAPCGTLCVEDLWSLPLKSKNVHSTTLDWIAINLNRQLKEQENTTFVDQPVDDTSELKLAFDIVLHIIAVRQAENAEKAKAVENAKLKQTILAIKSKRATEALEGKSDSELDALLAEL